MPQLVLQTAQQKLKALEATHRLEDRSEALQKDTEEIQLSIFNVDDPLLEELKDEITHLDLNTLTPIEAMMKLNLLQRKLGDKSI